MLQMSVMLKIFHIISLVQYVYAIHYDLNTVLMQQKEQPELIRPGFGGRLRFLTYWCMVSKKFKHKKCK